MRKAERRSRGTSTAFTNPTKPDSRFPLPQPQKAMRGTQPDPSDGTNTGNAVASSPVSILNSAPTITSLTPSSETPDTSEAITFTYQTNDDDGDDVSQTDVRWRLDGAVVSSLDNATTLPSVATRSGDVWEIELRVSDGTDRRHGSHHPPSWWAPATRHPRWPTSASRPPFRRRPTTTSLRLGLNPTRTTTNWWAMKLCGTATVRPLPRQGLNPLPGDLTAKGEIWVAQVRVSDGEAWSPWTNSDEITVANAPPTVAKVELSSPTFSALHDLAVNFTASDDDGDDASLVEVRWFLDDVRQTDVGNEDRLPAAHLCAGTPGTPSSS